ncbi:transketolase family protein [Bacteroides sp. 519]|uniref:transketolase family protein n=1 Tax=Bacteroides sp. 519 TaxID=2302937 RepID=UPI0013CF53AB|nr:transketolase C-terminal domain-containing protein [Bacteroides sp. 519]NDV58031.1 transketolase [Bacteroides sp. 519]
MRTAFIKQLTEEAKTNNKIFLVVADLGFSVIEEFAELFPNQFLNVGIAEQNMIGVAAGLAKEGFNVYVYSIGNFPTLRCMEQIRYDVAYHNLSVKVVSVGAGYSYGSLGASHHATEDVGMLRTIPNMMVCSPADPVEVKALTSHSATFNGPMYIRLGKAGEAIVHPKDVSLKVGEFVPVSTHSNSSKALLVSGSILSYAMQFITNNHIQTNVFSVPFVKPLSKNYIKNFLSGYSDIVVLEEHQKSGGVGSAFIEVVNDLYANNEISVYPRIRRIAIDDKFYSVSGSQAYIRSQAGLVLSPDLFD